MRASCPREPRATSFQEKQRGKWVTQVRRSQVTFSNLADPWWFICEMVKMLSEQTNTHLPLRYGMKCLSARCTVRSSADHCPQAVLFFHTASYPWREASVVMDSHRDGTEPNGVIVKALSLSMGTGQGGTAVTPWPSCASATWYPSESNRAPFDEAEW